MCVCVIYIATQEKVNNSPFAHGGVYSAMVKQNISQKVECTRGARPCGYISEVVRYTLCGCFLLTLCSLSRCSGPPWGVITIKSSRLLTREFKGPKAPPKLSLGANYDFAQLTIHYFDKNYYFIILFLFAM